MIRLSTMIRLGPGYVFLFSGEALTELAAESPSRSLGSPGWRLEDPSWTWEYKSFKEWRSPGWRLEDPSRTCEYKSFKEWRRRQRPLPPLRPQPPSPLWPVLRHAPPPARAGRPMICGGGCGCGPGRGNTFRRTYSAASWKNWERKACAAASPAAPAPTRSAAACAPSAALRRRPVMEGGPCPLFVSASASGSPARSSSPKRFPPPWRARAKPRRECGSLPQESPSGRGCGLGSSLDCTKSSK